VGQDLPEPAGHDGDDPEQQALQADSVGLALLVVLDSLTPAERLGGWPAGPGAGSRGRPRPTPTWPASGRWRTPSWPTPTASAGWS
jgi:hypothetical protein